jgi:hypothetical protein
MHQPTEEEMDAISKPFGPAQPAAALARTGLVMTDLAAAPLLALAVATLLGLALSAAGVAAGGVVLALGLPSFGVLPWMPAAGRILGGISLLSLSALLVVGTLLLFRLARRAWSLFRGWHRAAWRGVAAVGTETAEVSGRRRGARALLRPLTVSGVLFLSLLAVTVGLLFVAARGPFWHAWGWFV